MQNMRDNIIINLKWLKDPELDTDFDQLSRYKCYVFRIKPIDIYNDCTTIWAGTFLFIYKYINKYIIYNIS